MAVVAGEERPLMLTARPGLHLSDLLTADPEPILDLAMRRGVVLLRGLPICSAEELGPLGDWLLAGQTAMATGEHPVDADHGFMYRAVPYAPREELLWHHENCFAATWPRFVMLSTWTPAQTGGETTLVDSRIVTERMPSIVADRIASVGLEYERRCDGIGGRSWQELFGTSDPDEALARAAEQDELLDFGPGAPTVRLRRSGLLQVPGGRSWFNQILHWHPVALPARLRSLVRGGLVPQPRDVRYGDGGVIDDGTVGLLADLHREVSFRVTCRVGDCLLMDNRIVAHGRRPFEGDRLVFVRLAGPSGHESLVTAPS